MRDTGAAMKVAHLAIGILSVALMGGAGAWGAWCWYRVRPSRLFWRLLRAGQAVVVAVASAQMVLDARGFASAAEVGELPAPEQRLVVTSIVQRELGVMVLAALVILVLLVRAASTGG